MYIRKKCIFLLFDVFFDALSQSEIFFDWPWITVAPSFLDGHKQKIIIVSEEKCIRDFT